MKQRFYVDWTDAPFPQIVPIEKASEYAEPVTITEARQEIIRHFQADIIHAREQISRARSLTVAEIMKEAEEW